MSAFKIDKNGNWHYRGVEMSRRDIVTLFYRHLLKDDSGRCFIQIGVQRCFVEIEDTAYVVWSICRAGGSGGSEQGIGLLLSDDSVEELNPATLRIGAMNVPYCVVKNGSFDARFVTSSYYQLADFISHDPQRDQYYISLKGQNYYIPVAQGA
jgi:hypothetical protein